MPIIVIDNPLIVPKNELIAATTGSLKIKELDAKLKVSLYFPLEQTWRVFKATDEVDLNKISLFKIEGLQSGKSTIKFEHIIGDIKTDVEAACHIVAAGIRVDSNRDGKVTIDEKNCDKWIWGNDQPGAILMVNNDKDGDDTQGNSEFSEVLIIPPGEIPKNHYFRIVTKNEETAKKFGLFIKEGTGRKLVLGLDEKQLRHLPIVNSTELPVDPQKGLTLYITGWRYPDENFDGFIPLELQLYNKMTRRPISSANAVLRAAPWIMLPHTLKATKVYASDVTSTGEDLDFSNSAFLKDLKKILDKEAIPLQIASKPQSAGDRWMQDELEIGFSRGASHALPVVFDLPRDRGLDNFPESLQERDFGWFSIPVPENQRSSLDYGGNIEVSPPVKVGEHYYPFGRIVYGGGKKFWNINRAREIAPPMRIFFDKQIVQSPIEIFTDWLHVGHVDEIINFIPRQDGKSFVVASASINAARDLLNKLYSENQGNVVMFKGKQRYIFGDDDRTVTTEPADISVVKLLQDQAFWEDNTRFQSYQDRNEQILKFELGLQATDFVPIVSLFKKAEQKRTVAFFPGMVNSLVIGGNSKLMIVPKPFGPHVNNVDQFEKAFKDALPWMQPAFVDDWSSYHELSGEIHCGTNVLREMPKEPWWNYKGPDAENYTVPVARI